jgi:glycosyltransferase involved in cell wall biosynthesis
MMASARRRHALFVQYTNPAGYPPLEHAMGILLAAGWTVHCLGINAAGGASALALPAHPNLVVETMLRPHPGLRQKLQFVAFCVRATWRLLTQRPSLVYASDPMASPVALAATLLSVPTVVYHEHDAPGRNVSGFAAFILRLRDSICRRANWVVVPNRGRASELVTTTAVQEGRVLTVFNCPGRSESADVFRALPVLAADKPVWLYFHGSIVPDRLPLPVVEAMALLPDNVCLRIAGYETVGSTGYTERIKSRARELGVAHRIEALGPIPDRSALLAHARASHLGLALMPMQSDDINMRHMVGASNKPFDYLACGCPLVVSDLNDWKQMYVAAGLASACDPDSAESIAAAVHYWLASETRYREAQESGLARIAADWNYEAQFAPLLARIEAAPPA